MPKTMHAILLSGPVAPDELTVTDMPVPEARGRRNLTIRAQTLVDRVVVEQGRAVGVRLADE
ncbi:hypothetical protein [Streptomyces sp. NPDC017230]|uniref:hypothetical protein n=1 Tax=unclassified Streptomyces TaxID=2593676 RepID=UPI00378DBE18